MKRHNNEGVHDDEGEEEILRHNWQKAFDISEEEYTEFDPDCDAMVNECIE